MPAKRESGIEVSKIHAVTSGFRFMSSTPHRIDPPQAFVPFVHVGDPLSDRDDSDNSQPSPDKKTPLGSSSAAGRSASKTTSMNRVDAAHPQTSARTGASFPTGEPSPADRSGGGQQVETIETRAGRPSRFESQGFGPAVGTHASATRDDSGAGSDSDRDSRTDWLDLQAEDLIGRLQAWASELDAREAGLNARLAAQDHRERQFRMRQHDHATEMAEQQRVIERIRADLETRARRLAFAEPSV